MEKNIAYIVQLEWKTDGVTEFEIIKVCDTKEIADKCFAETKNKIMHEWAKDDDDDDFKIETNNNTLFEYQCNNWDIYYILILKPYKICK